MAVIKFESYIAINHTAVAPPTGLREDKKMMTEMLMESVILAFTLGGIVGAIAALHLTHAPAKAETKVEAKRVRR